MAANVDENFADFEINFSSDDPLADYGRILDIKIQADVSSEVHKECWDKISAAARDCIWRMLFDEHNPAQNEQLGKASDFLNVHKEDACFYEPYEYNKWIVLVRDELLKRNMLDFWKYEIVRKQLGPCCSRDSEFFESEDDVEAERFYRYAGCEAPWLTKRLPDESLTP